MSDHEGPDADEWEEGSLTATTEDIQAEEVKQMTKNIHEVSETVSDRMCPSRLALSTDLTFRGSTHGQVAYEPDSNSAGASSESSAFRSWKQHEPPNGDYTFSSTWNTLMSNLPEHGLTSLEVVRNRLDQICTLTESYIPTPEGETNKLVIYGSDSQVNHARKQLKLFEADVRGANGKRPTKANWIKMRALDGRKEHRDEHRIQLLETLKGCRLSEDDQCFDFEDHFIWPKDPDLDLFKAEYDASVMEELRKRYHCSIRYDTLNRFVHVRAHSEADVHLIRNRMINLMREMIARLNQRRRINLFHLPSEPMYRSCVVLDQDCSNKIFLPKLFRADLPKEESTDWGRLRSHINKRNRVQVCNAIHQSIKSLNVSQTHVRMRVTFGELGFRRYRKPADGQEWYNFDDFYEMVRNDRTEIEQQSLRSTLGDMSGFIDCLKASGAFFEPSEAYGVYFDFRESSQTATLRQQSEFRKIADLEELEMCQSRWLEFRSGGQNDLLEVNMLDFEKTNWQLHLGATHFSKNSLIRGRLSTFAHNLNFRIPCHGINSAPQRRAIFPPGHEMLREVSERILLRFPLRNSEGTLEVRRTDVYNQKMRQWDPLPSSTSWTAAHYYREWDNLFGEYADLKPGQQVSWPRSLVTLFPEEHDVQEGLPKGFKKFLREVETIQDLLTEALSSVMQVKTNGEH